MRTLEENEAIIEAGLKSFVAMGEALKEIRDGKQYEKRYGTGVGWESYCLQRWGMSQQDVSQLLLDSEAVARLKSTEISVVLPDKQSQVKELRKAPVAQQPAVWVEAVKEAEKNGRQQPTAKEVSKVIANMSPEKKAEKAEKAKKKRQEKKEQEQQRISMIDAAREGEIALVWEKIRWEVEPFLDSLFSKFDDKDEALDVMFAINKYMDELIFKDIRKSE